MEKKHNSCPVEKFFKAITVSSPFRLIHRVSNHHLNNPSLNLSASASASIPTDKTRQHTPKHPKPVVVASEVVPIRFDYSSPQKNGKPSKNTKPISKFVEAKKIATKHKAEAAAAQEKRYKLATRMESNNKMNANMEEDEFTKYIIRAGNKIRTSSSVGDGKINASASGEDHFSDYIDRAKKKMLRTMSSFVGGK